jgi:hypothetical protein
VYVTRDKHYFYVLKSGISSDNGAYSDLHDHITQIKILSYSPLLYSTELLNTSTTAENDLGKIYFNTTR